MEEPSSRLISSCLIGVGRLIGSRLIGVRLHKKPLSNSGDNPPSACVIVGDNLLLFCACIDNVQWVWRDCMFLNTL